MRHRAFVALVSGSLVLGACFNSGKGPAVPANQAAKPAGPDYSATLADPVGFLPVDSELVISLDAELVRKSVLWPLVEGRLADARELAQFKTECGFDPSTSIRGITAGFKHLTDEAKVEGVLVISGLDRARMMDCATRMSTRQKGLVVDGDTVRIQGTGTDPSVVFAFVDGATAVLHVGRNVTKQTLHAALAAGAPLRTSAAFMQMIAKLDLEAAVWGAANGNARMFDQAAAMGVKPKAVFGSVKLTTGLDANIRVRLESAQVAQTLTTSVQGQLGMAKSFFDKLDVTADDADMVVLAGMSEQQLTNMLGLLGGMVSP